MGQAGDVPVCDKYGELTSLRVVGHANNIDVVGV